jgi:hypothetical protein
VNYYSSRGTKVVVMKLEKQNQIHNHTKTHIKLYIQKWFSDWFSWSLNDVASSGAQGRRV